MVAHAFCSAIRRLRQADPCEFQARPVYRESFRTAMSMQRNPVSKYTLSPKEKKRKNNKLGFKKEKPKRKGNKVNSK